MLPLSPIVCIAMLSINSIQPWNMAEFHATLPSASWAGCAQECKFNADVSACQPSTCGSIVVDVQGHSEFEACFGLHIIN